MRKPIFYIVDGTLLEEHGITGLEVSSFKHKFGYGGNDNSIRSIRLRNRLRIPTTSENELWCNYFQHCSQYVEDYSLSSSEPSCDEINWPSSASPHGINCNNGFIDDDGILSHVPTPCGSSNIVTTNPNSKGGANFVEEKGVVETPASKNGINCNND